MICEKRAKCSHENCRLRSFCAVRPNCPGSNLLLLANFLYVNTRHTSGDASNPSTVSGGLFLSLTTHFRLFRTKRGRRRQFQIWVKRRKVLQKFGKHCGKRRNCSFRSISPFPTVLLKGYYCRHVKIRACLGKV